MRKVYPFVFILYFFTQVSWAQKAIEIGKGSNRVGEVLIIGKVMDYETGETLIGATVIVDELKKGEVTDINGMFGLYVPVGEYTLTISSVGFQELKQLIIVNGTGEFKLRLLASITELEEVLIQSQEADVNVKSTDLGKNTLSMESIKALPPFAGEVDILKSITLLPGVTSVGEASSGFNVRGGGSDQNLILLGGAVLYNPSHLFGFFSAFNSDLIRNVIIYKGGIPAKYGGRASSILDLEYRKGNNKRWGVKGSLGLVSLKLAIEGPIVKDKLSVLLGVRTSYSNWLLKSINDANIKNSSTQFYDLNGLVNYQLNNKNDLNYSFYRSYDDFKFASDTTNAWTNMAHVFDWKHAFAEKTIFHSIFSRSDYEFSINNKVGTNNFSINSKIIDQGVNLGLEFGVGKKGIVLVGVQVKQIEIDPGNLLPINEQSAINALDLESEQAIEGGAYAQHDFEIGKLGVSYGLRYNRFYYLGSNTIYQYEENLPRNEENIINQTTFGKGDVIKDYDGFEPRLSLRWSINTNTSIKLGYNRMFQYIHLISNTATISPTDIWKLTDQFVKPEIGSQISFGIFKNFSNNTIETSVEGYYKKLQNIVEYKDGADLIMNEHIETELLNGDGRTYGVELYVKKTFGRLEGWASYTYSKSLREVKGPYPEETINLGKEYPSNFDKPHDLTTVIDYSINDKVKFSSIFTYSTGRAVTTPSAKFGYYNQNVSFFNARNNGRAPDYHRLDVSLTFSFQSRHRLLQGDWVLSVYNLYGRKNAFSVFFDDVDGAPPQAYKMSVLGIPFPTLSYYFEF